MQTLNWIEGIARQNLVISFIEFYINSLDLFNVGCEFLKTMILFIESFYYVNILLYKFINWIEGMARQKFV